MTVQGINTRAEAKAALPKARERVAACKRDYNAAWRKDPTSRGYPKVDEALGDLQDAEADVRELETLANA